MIIINIIIIIIIIILLYKITNNSNDTDNDDNDNDNDNNNIFIKELRNFLKLLVFFFLEKTTNIIRLTLEKYLKLKDIHYLKI